MASIQDIRAALGPDANGRSDEELLSSYASATGMSPQQVAAQFDYNPTNSGKWGSRFSASVDNAQGSLYGVAEAAGLGDWARRGRASNNFAAQVGQERARNQGAIFSYKDVNGIGDAADYVGGLAVDSAPQMGAIVAGGLAGGPAGAGAAAYGFALGDVLENQREQSGKTDLLSAAGLALPYAAVDALTGVGGRLASRTLTSVRAFANTPGLRGLAARTAVGAGKTALAEGAGETFQEGMNQLGRMAVDPNAEFLSPDARDRYLESFIGGAALGGAMGSFHRTKSNPSGAISEQQAPSGYQATYQLPVVSPRIDPTIVPEANPNVQSFLDETLVNQRTAPADYPAQFEAAASEPTGNMLPGENGIERPETQLDVVQRGLAPTNPQAAAAVDPINAQLAQAQQARARAVASAQQAAQAEAATTPEQSAVRQTIARTAAQERMLEDEARGYGITRTPAVSTFKDLSDLHVNGLVDDKKFAELTGKLTSASSLPAVRREIADVRKRAVAEAEMKKAAEATKAKEQADTQAAIDRMKQPTVQVGRTGREQTVTRGELEAKLANAPLKDRMHLMALMGAEITPDPDTGAPRAVYTGQPRTMAEAAKYVAKGIGGKPVTKGALGNMLKKYGITEADISAATAATAPDAVTANELGIGVGEDGAGTGAFRTEQTLSEATNEGLVQGRTLNAREQALSDQADALLADAPQEQAVNQVQDTEQEAANQAQIEANTRTILSDPFAESASDWWDGTTPWEQLPDRAKADWVIDAYEMYDHYGSLTDIPETAWDSTQRRLEKKYGLTEQTQPAGRAETAQRDGGVLPADRKAVSTPTQGPAEQAVENDASAGTGSYVGEAGARQGQDRQQAVVTVKKSRKIDPAEVARLNASAVAPNVPMNGEAMYSKDTAGGSTVARVMTEIAKLRLNLDPKKVVVVQSQSELPAFIQASLEGDNVKPQGFVLGGRAFLIADNIKPGNARSVFLHEVGSHMGIENLLSAKEFGRLANKVVEWADRNDGSVESELARKAIRRVGNAGTPSHQMHSEVVAYMVEEATRAGIDPTALQYKSEIGRWMGELVRAIKDALKKLGFVNAEGLTAQDIVDLAYGAAQLELKVDNRAVDVPKFSIALPEGTPKLASETQELVKALSKQGFDRAKVTLAFTEDLARMASKVLPSVNEYIRRVKEANVEKVRAERNIEVILDGYNALPREERGTGPGSVNDFLRESTLRKAWGYAPEYHKNIAVDPQMATKFNALSPEGQNLVRDVFKHGHDNLKATKQAIIDNVTSEYDAQIAAAKQLNDTEQVAALQKEKLKSLDHVSGLVHFNATFPYAPLKRFGNYVVLGMSRAYLDAEKAGNTELLREMQADPAHYHVQFAETMREAIAQQQELDRSGRFAGGLVDSFSKDDDSSKFYGGRDTTGALRRLRNLVEDSADAGLNTAGRKAINRMLNELHLALMSEASVRQSERNRVGVSGADKDMMRAFVTQGRASANFVASLKSSGKITESLMDMKQEADARTEGRAERREYFNEFMKRHVMGMDYQPSPLIEKAMRATSGYMLLTSPAYFLTNATQPFAMSLPILAAKRGHGYAKSFGALSRAYRELLPILKSGKLPKGDYSELPADIREQVKALADRGVIEISLDKELGNFQSVDTGSKKFGAVAAKIGQVAQAVETINRLSTAIAALRLARDSGLNQEAQVKSASDVIYETHGDYSAFNAPRYMRAPIGRLLTQFRKFQLIQISLFTRLAHDAFKGADPETRFVARKALAFSLGHMFILGGALGMPGAQAISFMLRQIFGDDDEPDNPELTLRELVGGGPLADLLVKGAPAALGVDLSGRLGAGNMLSLLPYSDLSLDEDGYKNALLGASGPFLGGMGFKLAQAMGLIHEGQYYKGLEMAMPKGVGDLAKSLRMGSEGVTQRNGDVVMSPDDLSFLDLTMQAVGLPTTTITDRTFKASAKFNSEQFYKDRSSTLKKQYTEAYRSGDADKMGELRQEWMSVQQARREHGYKVQPLSELIRAPREQQGRERNTLAGVQFQRGQRQAAEQLDELM